MAKEKIAKLLETYGSLIVDQNDAKTLVSNFINNDSKDPELVSLLLKQLNSYFTPESAKKFALAEVFPDPKNMLLLPIFTSWYNALDKKQEASSNSTTTMLQDMSADLSLVGQASEDADAATDEQPKQASTPRRGSGYSASEEWQDSLDLPAHEDSVNSDSSSYSPRG